MATTTTSSGTVTSFSNSPQAKDDTFTTGLIDGLSGSLITEDLVGVVYLDVMANDLGGNAKTLWSLDNAESLSTATKSYAPTDLLTQDTARFEGVSNDTSLNGARIWITMDGKVGYDAGTLSTTFKNALQALSAGQTLSDTFTYSIRLGNGTLSWATAQVSFAGSNDAAIITGSSTAGLTETNAAQSTSGNLDASDVDSSAAFVVQTNVAGINGYGTFSIDDTGAWTYTMNGAHDEFVGGVDYTDSITVATADGTSRMLTVTMHGSNDAAIITGSSTAGLTETNDAQSTGGNLDASDVDSSAAFVVQTNVAGGNGYGTFSIDASGAWTYTMSSAHDEFVGGVDYTDSITVATADGTSRVLTVTMHGTNDAAIITGSSTAELTETNAAQSTGGNLDASDVDSSAAFVVQTNVVGSNNYGTFSIDASGAWSYTMNGAHDEFAAGQDYTDSITVATADGTSRVLTVTMHGSNDAAVITGSSTASLTETNAAQSTGGNLDATDVDSSNAFVVQTNVAGINGYGTFSIDASGAWIYTMNGAHDEFVGGVDYTDSITVATADGTSRMLTVTMHGSNDAAIITGSSTASLTETNAAQSTSGNLDASDVDSSAAFVVQTNVAGGNGYGTFSIDDTGAWTYTMSSAHDEFVGGVDYTDSITVATADGTSRVLTVTMHGSNDAAIITGSSTASLTESNAAQSTGGNLDATDVDSSNAFVAQTNVVGSNNYGTFSIDASGAWTYTMSSAHDEFVGGVDYTDSITVATADGTSRVLTVTMHGTNDAAIITGSSTAGLTETNAALSTSGTLTSDDVDNPDNAFNASTTLGTIGNFAIDAAGAWTFTANGAFDQLNVDDSVSETYQVTSVDGTPSTVKITITGANDGPVAVVDTAAGTENQTLTIDVLGNDTDIDDDHAFTINSVNAPSDKGTASILDNKVVFNPGTAFDHLAQGVQELVTLSYSMQDEHGATSTSTIDITITGSNDAAVIAGVATGNVQEDTNVVGGLLNTSGSLTVSDADTGQSGFLAQPTVAGIYGTFTLTATGNWTYSVNNSLVVIQALGTGQSLLDSFVAHSLDGSDSQSVQVTILGLNDNTTLTGTTGNNNYDFSATGSGVYTITDPGGNNDAIRITGDNSTLTTLNFERSGNDLLIDVGNQDITVLNHYGASGNAVDNITFAAGQSYFGYALAGTYSIFSGSSFDAGNGSSNDVVAGTSGNQTIDGGGGASGRDLLFGNAGNDTLSGQNDDDLLIGGGGNDILSGSDGNDLLIGGTGSDSLTGGAGADRFAFAEADPLNLDSVLDYSFSLGDSLDLSTLLDSNFVSGSQVSDFVQVAQTGSNIRVQVDTNGSAGGANFVDVATLIGYGTSGADLVRTYFEGAEHQLSA